MSDDQQDPATADTIGAMIRQQRELAELSMRQLATMAGISNPYLSQIERGLRAPSQQVITALADSLQMSADVLHESTDGATQAEVDRSVVDAVKNDPGLTASQRRALIETYHAFRQLTIDRRRVRARGR